MLSSIWMTTRWALLPILFGMIISYLLLPELQINNELLHVIIEGGGALMGFGLAYILLAMIQKKLLSANYIWLIACFISMGTLDLAHSQLHPGQAFVWLHSCATFIGGMFALLIWLPPHHSEKFIKTGYFWLIISLATIFSICSIIWPESSLVMLDKNQNFTIGAVILNVTGGIGFLFAWFYFTLEYHKKNNSQSFFFSNHFLLFSLAALVFEVSSLWDAHWWFWHMMRGFAYLLLIFHFASKYRQNLLNKIEQSSNILDHSLNEIYIIDIKTLEYVDVNLSAQENNGYSLVELQSKTPADIIRDTSKEDFLKLVSPLLNASEKRIFTSSQYQRKDNSYYSVEGYIQLTQNTPQQLVAIMLDVTERKQKESELYNLSNRLQKIASRLPGMVYEYKLNANGKACIPYTSDAIQDIFGVAADEVREDSSILFSKIHPDDLAATITSIQASKESDKPWQHEFRITDDNKSVRWLYGNSVPGYEADGSVSWFGFITDISAQKSAEAEKEHLQQVIHQAQKMDALGNLTGGIAHDFNNILGIILGNIELANDQSKALQNNKLNNHLTTIQKATERARKLVAQMMQYSRIDQSESQPMDLAVSIKNDMNMLKAILPSSMEIDLNYEKDLPMVIMDPIKLQQILMNLCLNAKDAMNGIGKLSINYSLSKNVDIKCTSCSHQLSGDWLELNISDSGSGIEADTLKQIFEPFFTTKQVGKGTGMGLAVVESTVKSFNGHIVVHSELGKGTIFRILFKAVSSENLQPHNNKDKPPLITENNGDGQSILIVDDEPDLAQVISEILKINDYKTTVITSSVDALNQFQSTPDAFDLIITDQTMPELTGYDMVLKMRKIRPQIPVILATGYSDLSIQQEAKTQNIKFMKKPVRNKDLNTAVAQLLKKAQ